MRPLDLVLQAHTPTIYQHIKKKKKTNMPWWTKLTIEKNEIQYETTIEYEILNVIVEVNS